MCIFAANNYIHRIIMEATVNKIQVNVMTVANAVVVKAEEHMKYWIWALENAVCASVVRKVQENYYNTMK